MSVFTSLVRGVCLLSVLTCMVLAACQPLPASKVAAISNQPQTWKKFVAIVRLKGKSLLETLVVDAEGREVIDTEHKAALLAEQERVIAELQALSDEIVVLYRYHLVLNAIAIVAPRAVKEQIENLDKVVMVADETFFNPPQPYVVTALEDEIEGESEPLRVDSAAFIGSRDVHEKLRATNRDGVPVPVRGEGVRVAIIDTGIDYTHKAFGGSGNVDDYKNNDPAVLEPDTFPTRKVLAGIDLVGDDYDASEGDIEKHIPRGDPDPLDEGAHGTHVAGIVAGIGDGSNTHDGVAPDASLIAIKVFAGGSTSDVVIIKALEYALDPNGDFDLNDRAQVANLSLGSNFGIPNSIYSDAVGNAVRGGMVVVAAAGNSGAYDYIVSEPSTADAAISVAASVDDAEHNWKIPAIKFSGDKGLNITAEAVESPMGKTIAQVGELVAPLYHIGLANRDLTDEQKEQLQGKVALIDRGLVTFVSKIDRAIAAGAVGVVMVNNLNGAPIPMGGAEKYDIPAVMITKRVGTEIKTALQEGSMVSATFKAGLFLERQELIDSLASFSSHGPRTFDSLLKPEIAAPGVSITSAFSGGGDRGIRLSGTSMATPHVSGVVALMRQYRAALSPALIKNMLVANAKLMHSPAGVRYPTYQQGGGRVAAFNAVTAEVVFQPATLSLGRVLIANNKKIAGYFNLRNLSEKDMTITLQAHVLANMTFTIPTQVTLAAGAQTRVDFELLITAERLKQPYTNLDGYIEASNEGQTVARLPMVLGVQRLARVETRGAIINANSEDDAYRAVIDVKFANAGASAGEALLFNFLAHDERIEHVRRIPLVDDKTCDLQSAGYRIVEQTIDEQKELVIQFAAKLYHPRTTWNYCALSVQFDGNGDGVADQELVGDTLDSIRDGSSRDAAMFLSFLTDAHKMRAIRASHELRGVRANYSEAIVSVLPLNVYNHSTLTVASARLRDVVTNDEGDVRIRLAIESAVEPDYLTNHGDIWHTITPTRDGVGFWGMPDSVSIPSGGTHEVTLSKGGDPDAQLIAYFPHNASTFSPLREDRQSSVLALSYQP